MYKKTFMVFLLISMLVLVAGCTASKSNSDTNNEDTNLTQKNNTSTPDQTELAPPQKPIETEPSDNIDNNDIESPLGFETYSNDKYKISIYFPDDWEDITENDEDEELVVLTYTIDFATVISLTVKKIDSALPTLESFKNETADFYDEFDIKEEMLTINEVEFYKLIVDQTEVGVTNIFYVAYANGNSYEIAISLDTVDLEKYQPLIDNIGNSIKIIS
jgi:hypothetical protein